MWCVEAMSRLLICIDCNSSINDDVPSLSSIAAICFIMMPAANSPPISKWLVSWSKPRLLKNKTPIFCNHWSSQWTSTYRCPIACRPFHMIDDDSIHNWMWWLPASSTPNTLTWFLLLKYLNSVSLVRENMDDDDDDDENNDSSLFTSWLSSPLQIFRLIAWKFLLVMSIDFNRKNNRGRRLNRTEVDTLLSYRFNNNHDDDDDDENNRKTADCTIRRPIRE